MTIDDKKLKQIQSAYHRQKTRKAEATIDAVVGMLLDLALECYGPITGHNPATVSQAAGLEYYSKYPEFCALLHTCGLGAELKLAQPEPAAMTKWAKIKQNTCGL